MQLCMQAKFYALISFLLILYIIIKNPETNRYDIIILIIKVVVFISWTFVLNKMCNAGYKYFAWAAAIVPHLIYILVIMNFQQN